MGRKKKRAADKVFCYYCDREFDDEKILVQHQKAKHFKCHACNKRLSTVKGMVLHVLQVHKEAVTRVPNAKPSRESTEIEIHGMQGIPPEVLAAYYETPSKSARVDNPTSNVGDGTGVIPGGGAVGVTFPPQTTYGVMQPPIYNQPWYPPPAAVSMPPGAPVNLPQHPFFPATNITSLSSFSPVPPQPLFQSNVAGVHSSASLVNPAPQPLFPAGATASIHNQSLTITPPPLAASMSAHPDSHANAVNQFHVPTTGSVDSITFTSGPKTGGPSIGPPPPIANKVPDWVYFAWGDEAMSMEERRMALPKYRVRGQISQMSSIDKAIDRRISETWRDAAR